MTSEHTSQLLKVCTDCGTPKPLDAFYRLRRGEEARAALCASCCNARRTENARDKAPPRLRLVPPASPFVRRGPRCLACWDDPRRVNGGTCAACGLERRV